MVWMSVGAGIGSGLLAVLARRAPLLAWIALCPFGLALSRCGPWTAVAGALLGAALHGAATWSQPAHLRWLGFVFGAIGWGIVAGAAGVAFDLLRASWPSALLLTALLPLVALLAAQPMRRAGAPRWIYAALACTQEPWPAVLRAGWIGGDATVTTLLSLSSVAMCLLAPGDARAPWLALLLGALVLTALALAARSLARTRRAIASQRRVRVAAVVVNGAPPPDRPSDPLWPMRSPEYRDVEGTLARYEPHVRRAARAGAELIVLPEAVVRADGDDVARWRSTIAQWARELDVTIVAPHFDAVTPTNTLTIHEPSGTRWEHDKQHPAPGIEPAPRTREPPGPFPLERGWNLSAVLCVDLDYADLVGPVRAAGGLLVAPANDWAGFEDIHDRSAVWAAVLTGTTVLRATGHGLCSARDGAGRVLARASSFDGPTVMVVEAPVAT